MAEKKSKDVGYDKNVMTPEEFGELEKKEARRKLFGFGRKKDPAPPPPKPESTKQEKPKESKSDKGSERIDSLFLKIEKIEGKIESMEDIRKATDEKFSRLSEEIGELRSSLLEKDRSFDRVDAGFRKMEAIVEELEPTALKKELEKRSEGILKNQARIESMSTQTKELSKGLKEFRTILGKIKNIKNLIRMSSDMNSVLTKIQNERRSIAKTAGKTETIFSELSKKISEFDSYKDKVDFNAETMHDLMKSLDMLEVKLEGLLKKEDMNKIEEKMKDLETEVKDDTQDVRDIVSMLVASLKSTSLKDIIEKHGIESIPTVNDRVSQIQKRLESMENLGDNMNVMASDIEALRRGMEHYRIKSESADIKQKREVAEKKVTQQQQTSDALSEMVKYVRNCIDLGYSTKQIKSELMGKGWPRKTINEIILREVINKRKKMLSRGSGESKNLKKMVTSPR